MICSALLIEKRGPTCRDPRGALRVNAMDEDFEHGPGSSGKDDPGPC